MTARRFVALTMLCGLIAVLFLGLLPLSYTTVEGIRKDVGFVESQRVSCGRAFKPDYTPPPPGSDDHCDYTTNRRWILILALVGSTGVVAGGALVVPKVLRAFSAV